jgi:protocatechuate 3,4-dioxygenase beta subunit
LLSNSNPVKNQTVTLNINGKKLKTKTSKTGYFVLNRTTNKVGTNTLTVSYAGNKDYLSTNINKTFTVNQRATRISLEKISQKVYRDTVTITGKFTTFDGKPLKNTMVKVILNGRTMNTKTNAQGVFTRNIKVSTVATNNVTVIYGGNKNYKASSNKTTFTTVKRATKVTLNDISTAKKGSKIVISGKLTDNKGAPLMNTLVRVTVGGKSIDIKTNSNGVYNYNYKATSLGTFNVVVSYLGNKNYKTSNAKVTFTVKN